MYTLCFNTQCGFHIDPTAVCLDIYFHGWQGPTEQLLGLFYIKANLMWQQRLGSDIEIIFSINKLGHFIIHVDLSTVCKELINMVIRVGQGLARQGRIQGKGHGAMATPIRPH